MSATSEPGRTDDAFSKALRAGPLRALDGRGRADVRASGKLRQHEAGAVIFHASEPADLLFVVARGAVRLENAGQTPTPAVPPWGLRSVASRTVRPGELFGREALVPFAVRGGRAVALEASSVLELPGSVLKRVLVRAGFPELLAREEARARRVEWTALLGRTALGALPPEEIDTLAALLVEEARERGEALEGPGDGPSGAWLVAGGLFELSAADRTAAPPAYAARGDFIGVSAVLRAGAGATRAVALGSALALRFPPGALERVAARHPFVLAALERALSARETKQRGTLEAAQRPATRHAGDEVERLESARSLLAIDLDRCTRCGHCTWACAESHGSARLERRGDKVLVTLRNADSAAATALLLPNACQHCREPSCLDPCPTGAIRRDATGAVELDLDLCTGCGACAKACPWDAIRMAPRPADPKAPAAKSAQVAVKCDLCRGLDGPECVSACPTEAIFRLDPRRDVVEVRAIVGPSPKAQPAAVRGSRRWAKPLFALALVPPFVALERSLPDGPGGGARLVAGVVGLALVLVLAAHAVVKRVSSVRRRARRALSRSGTVSTVAPFVNFHAASGAVAAACVLLHGGSGVRSGVAGALWLAFWGVAATGALGAVVYRLLPRRLSRIERTSGLPEDEPKEREALVDRLHAAVSGANAAKKELVRRILAPYSAGLFGTLALIASGRSLAEEEALVRLRVERALGGHKSERLVGIEPLVRAAVEMRALRARRLFGLVLRAWLPIHLAGSALVLALLAFHVVGALR